MTGLEPQSSTPEPRRVRGFASFVLTAALGVAAGAGLGGLVYLKTAPIPQDSRYVGSASCSGCHRPIHAAWGDSQHTKMMRPVDQPGVVVADFASQDAPFEKSEVVFVIGGKWEQQFMGHGPKGETLLPGAWPNIANTWQREGWDGWNQPVPLERCHGCHTVGLDVETGTFVEANIGCESCHGPAQWHVKTLGLGKITSIADAEVCGQCHSRGRHVNGKLHFPLGYRPGGKLEDYFKHVEPSPGQNSSDFWGNGRARSRHQEFLDWRGGGHADSLRSLREGYDGRFGAVRDDCLRCHAGEAALWPEREIGLSEARLGITCTVCHEVHGNLDRARRDCASCHEGGAYYHTPERNAAHVPCPESAQVGCVDCHMPKIVRIAGTEQLHSHAPGVVPPSDGAAFGMPTGCTQAGCHASTPLAVLQTAFETHSF